MHDTMHGIVYRIAAQYFGNTKLFGPLVMKLVVFMCVTSVYKLSYRKKRKHLAVGLAVTKLKKASVKARKRQKKKLFLCGWSSNRGHTMSQHNGLEWWIGIAGIF